MNNPVLLYIIIGMLLLLPSCAMPGDSMEPTMESSIALAVNTRGLDSEMKVRIIAVNSGDGKVIANEYPVSDTDGDGICNLTVKTGRINFYILMNEPAELTPILEGMDNRSELNPLMISIGQFPEVELPSNSLSASNLPSLQIVAAQIREKEGQPGKSEVSTNNGVTWGSVMEVDLKRVLTKISFFMRKDTEEAGDRIVIQNVTIDNVPYGCYLLPKTYDKNDFMTCTPAGFTPGITFTENADRGRDDNFTEIFAEYVIPEYILRDPSDRGKAVTITVEALYNNRKVKYSVPVSGPGDGSYSLLRNNHYAILATVSSKGEAIYAPEVRYKVVDWTDVENIFGFIKESSITFQSSWAPGTDISERNVYVRDNEYVEYRFNLTHPITAHWAATLTNPVDFAFDETGGAVSGGWAREGETYIIRIKPLKPFLRSNTKTEFFITVDTGLSLVELNLPADAVGSGNRYVITQTPY